MTASFVIFAEPGGFDSRLFFPSSLPIIRSTVGWNNPSSGFIDFIFGGTTYFISVTGANLQTTNSDLSGVFNGADLFKVSGGAAIKLANLTFFQSQTLASLFELTPNGLLNAVTNQSSSLTFQGNTGADKLFGSDYADFFNGQGGHDKLTGNGGNDTFLFDHIGKLDYDHVTDFQHKHDKISLDFSDDGLFAGVTNANLSRTFHDITAGISLEQADDRILYNHNTGVLSYDKDGKGGAAPVIFAVLDNHAKIDFHDIVVF